MRSVWRFGRRRGTILEKAEGRRYWSGVEVRWCVYWSLEALGCSKKHEEEL